MVKFLIEELHSYALDGALSFLRFPLKSINGKGRSSSIIKFALFFNTCIYLDSLQENLINRQQIFRVCLIALNIVACQRGGVSNEPPWPRATARHGPGTFKI